MAIEKASLVLEYTSIIISCVMGAALKGAQAVIEYGDGAFLSASSTVHMT